MVVADPFEMIGQVVEAGQFAQEVGQLVVAFDQEVGAEQVVPSVYLVEQVEVVLPLHEGAVPFVVVYPYFEGEGLAVEAGSSVVEDQVEAGSSSVGEAVPFVVADLAVAPYLEAVAALVVVADPFVEDWEEGLVETLKMEVDSFVV